MFDNLALDYATVSAVVAAFVSVVGNAFNIQSRYRALLAIIVGAAIVAMPDWLMQKSVTALLIGLTASGVYTQVKKRDYQGANYGTTNTNSDMTNSTMNATTNQEPNSSVSTQRRIQGPHDV